MSDGASKHDKEKTDLSLIPMVAMIAEAKALMIGEKKYGRYNYTKGHKASQLVAAAQRHLLAWFEGEELDPQDGQPHLGSVRACIAMLLRQQELGTLKDDRFKGESSVQVATNPPTAKEVTFQEEHQLTTVKVDRSYAP